MRILVVDDEFLIRQSLSRVATLRGHYVKMAKEGREALSLWLSFKPHLVFLDVLMPNIDGPSLLRKIKKPFNEVVIMMSAHKSFEESNIHLWGADGYVSKPFKSVISLFSKVESFCLKQKSNRGLDK